MSLESWTMSSVLHDARHTPCSSCCILARILGLDENAPKDKVFQMARDFPSSVLHCTLTTDCMKHKSDSSCPTALILELARC
eukprot:6137769-Amphidinium_carterae.1